MRRSHLLLLPLLLSLASCGISSQYGYQQFQDGIYCAATPEPVRIYTKEEFALMAAQSHVWQDRDTLKVQTNKKNTPNVNIYFGTAVGIGLGWGGWAWGGFHDPWYRPGWYDPWYDP